MHDRLLRPMMVAIAKGDVAGTPPDDVDWSTRSLRTRALQAFGFRVVRRKKLRFALSVSDTAGNSYNSEDGCRKRQCRGRRDKKQSGRLPLCFAVIGEPAITDSRAASIQAAMGVSDLPALFDCKQSVAFDAYLR